MAVITKYVIVRDGVELDLVFEVKKEAEAYDKMLDAADQLAKLIKVGAPDIELDDPTIEQIAVFLAKKAPEVTKCLKGIKPVVPKAQQSAGGKLTGRKITGDKPTAPASKPTKKKAAAAKSKGKK